MYVCVLDTAGEVQTHRNMTAVTGRTVYSMLKRGEAFDEEKFFGDSHG
jgi:hypothetical protein